MISVKTHACDFCGSCVAVCPENCIDLWEDQLVIQESVCTGCKLCIYVCPVESLELIDE